MAVASGWQRRLLMVGLPIFVFLAVLIGIPTVMIQRENSRYHVFAYEMKKPTCKLSDRGCKVMVTVTNLSGQRMDHPLFADTGGGPLANITYPSRLFDAEGNSCGAVASPVVASGKTVEPHGSVMLDVVCGVEHGNERQQKEVSRMGVPVRMVVYGKKYAL